MPHPRILAAAMLAGLPCPALAFDRCDDLFADPQKLAAFLYERGVHDGPVRFFDRAQAIRVETGEAPGGLIPHAGLDAEGKPVIYYPLAFPPVLCRVALATYVVLDGDNWRPFAEASRDAAVCVDSGAGFDGCLQTFSRDLEADYRADLTALGLDALGQIGVHEYAHLLLDHGRRIDEGGLARIDAEFEADLHAILNGTQIGEAPSAMFYFFKALADIESYSQTLGSHDYESGACRATNVEDITGALGIAPIALLSAADGGGRLGRNSPESVRETAERLRAEPAPAPSPDACGRVSAQVLGETHAELARLAALVADYAGGLFAEDTETARGLGLDDPAAFELIRRLETETAGFVHLDGLAAQTMSRLIQRVEYAGAEPAIAAELDRLIASGAPGLLARDYGRLLKVMGVLTAYDPDEPVEARLPEARRLFEAAVTYAPGQAEAWMNLAMIAATEARCADAAALADEAARAATGEPERTSATQLRDWLQAAAAEGDCPGIPFFE
jgi:hypothetical protein